MKLTKYLLIERLIITVIIFIMIRNLTISINQSYLFFTSSDLDYYNNTGLLSFTNSFPPNRYLIIPVIYLLYIFNIWNIILVSRYINLYDKLKNLIEVTFNLYLKFKEDEKIKQEIKKKEIEIEFNKISQKKSKEK
ncbi:hypothetical protein V6O07_02060 [Arthrospira platensis SPKY2]